MEFVCEGVVRDEEGVVRSDEGVVRDAEGVVRSEEDVVREGRELGGFIKTGFNWIFNETKQVTPCGGGAGDGGALLHTFLVSVQLNTTHIYNQWLLEKS